MGENALAPHASSQRQAALGPNGRYVQVATLGTGSQGAVFAVLDTRLRREVALKTIMIESPTARMSLKAEFRKFSRIRHPNLVRLHSLHEDRESCFFTMEIVRDARHFDRALGPVVGLGGTQFDAAVSRIRHASLQLASALHALHEFNMCHRDVKPSNVLVGRNGHVVLLDFGVSVSTSLPDAFDTSIGMPVMGTPAYMAPEQHLDPASRDPRSDWYSLGLLMFETITGDLPFATSSHTSIVEAKSAGLVSIAERAPELPRDLVELVDGLLAPDPAQRPTAQEIFDQLRTERGEVDPLSMRESRRATVFVGRRDELHVLRAAFDRVCSGQNEIVDIQGASGMGKSALLDNFLASIQGTAPDTLILRSRCHPNESIGYNAFDAAIDDLARCLYRLPQAEVAELLPAVGVRDLVSLFWSLGRVPAFHTNMAGATRDPSIERTSALGALKRIISAVCRTRPVIMAIDDAQWADYDSAHLMEAMFGRADAPSALVIIVRRKSQPCTLIDGLFANPESGPNAGVRVPVIPVELSPFGPETARECALAIVKTRDQSMSAALEALVHSRDSFEPYLLADLAFRAERSGLLPALAGSQDAWMDALLDRLDEADDQVVKTIATSPGPVPTSILLVAAPDYDIGRLQDLCEERVLTWVTAGDQGTLLVYHDSLREHVVRRMDAPTVRECNRRLLEAHEATLSTDDEAMVFHARAIGEVQRAVSYSLLAAQRAEGTYAFQAAADLYQYAVENSAPGDPIAGLHAALAEALANAGRSALSAAAFTAALSASEREEPGNLMLHAEHRRRAGEQFLKAGYFQNGLEMIEGFLKREGVQLPQTGAHALVISAARRARLYARGFRFQPRLPTAQEKAFLDGLWACTTALSMMDPVRSDGVGLLHFLEALRLGDNSHIARSMGYEAAFASLIGGEWLASKATMLLSLHEEALTRLGDPYVEAFYHLAAGTAAFFRSDWAACVSACDRATEMFTGKCHGAEYEAQVAKVFSLQALGQSGRVRDLVTRIPEAIEQAVARGDVFAANNCRGGYHALGRIAAGLTAQVRSDLRDVVDTWTTSREGMYQMHAYHRVIASVNCSLYEGDPLSAEQQIEADWPTLRAGLYLLMRLPAAELRWLRARAALAVVNHGGDLQSPSRLSRIRGLLRSIERSGIAAAPAHLAAIRAGLAALNGERDEVRHWLSCAVHGYSSASMAIHFRTAQWLLSSMVDDRHAAELRTEVGDWMIHETVPDMARLSAALFPGVARVTEHQPGNA